MFRSSRHLISLSLKINATTLFKPQNLTLNTFAINLLYQGCNSMGLAWLSGICARYCNSTLDLRVEILSLFWRTLLKNFERSVFACFKRAASSAYVPLYRQTTRCRPTPVDQTASAQTRSSTPAPSRASCSTRRRMSVSARIRSFTGTPASTAAFTPRTDS